ncbi:MAG: FIST C-terminal domain-containing protein [Gammaproteobacteria bacterium]|nr:FIST C-terminal domain-containing protein [Gammaproteobacteria bacterium]MCF6260424.1 FIST C-terminal domain-containing protein [Gammaproteobacteria bacterium]
MKIEQMQWTESTGWSSEIPGALATDANLVLVFGSTEHLKNKWHITNIRKAYPNALISGCSTAGEIFDATVLDGSLSVTAIHFEHTQLQTTHTRINNPEDSFRCGKKLAQTISHQGLRHVFVLSDGLNTNSNELISGLNEQLPSGVTITGGLSGDAGHFEETLVLWQDKAQPHVVTLIGLYGKALKIGFSSLGNWGSLEPEHTDTHASSNTRYEMDGKSALELYKSHLGEHAAYLPTTNTQPPVDIHFADRAARPAKTSLTTDENEQSMTFTDNIPEGSHTHLTKENVNRPADDTIAATKTSPPTLNKPSAELAILISCVRRKMAFRQKTKKEIEGIREMLGAQPTLTGFYSYGEISPFSPDTKRESHNQTMTITILSET